MLGFRPLGWKYGNTDNHTTIDLLVDEGDQAGSSFLPRPQDRDVFMF